MRQLIAVFIAAALAGCNLPQTPQTPSPTNGTPTALLDQPTLTVSPSETPAESLTAIPAAGEPSEPLPDLGGAAHALLYAVHTPAEPNPVTPYDVTLMALPLDGLGVPAGASQIWKEWDKFTHAGMYALPDHEGIVEMSGFEAGVDSILTRFDAGESWTTRITVDSTFPVPMGWTWDSRALLANYGETIWLIRREGAQPLIAPFPTEPGPSSAALSPDRQALVYSTGSRDDIPAALWRLDPVSGMAEKLAEFGVENPADALVWSPDGQWLAFKRNLQVNIIRPDGSGLQRIEDVTSDNAEPLQWSPDGTMLAFVGHPPGAVPWSQDPDTLAFQYTAYVVEVTADGFGSARPVVASGQSGMIDPSWSPDGQWLLVVGPSVDQADVWLASRDGETVSQLTFDGGTKRYPVWVLPDVP